MHTHLNINRYSALFLSYKGFLLKVGEGKADHQSQGHQDCQARRGGQNVDKGLTVT